MEILLSFQSGILLESSFYMQTKNKIVCLLHFAQGPNQVGHKCQEIFFLNWKTKTSN